MEAEKALKKMGVNDRTVQRVSGIPRPSLGHIF